MKAELSGIFDAAILNIIEQEICSNAAQLFSLGKEHFEFAVRLRTPDWRQKASRFYYAAYNIVRAIKLSHSGEYSQQSDDHKRVDQLPDDFPSRSRYATQFKIMREDRNVSDYDHTATLSSLNISLTDAQALLEDFLNDAVGYLRNKGVTIP